MKMIASGILAFLVLVSLAFQAGCGDDDEFDFREATVSTPPPVSLPAPEPVDAVAVFTGVGFQAPVFLAAVPGDDGLLAVVEQAGVIKVFDEEEGDRAGVLLDISGKVKSGGEQGLIGLAFDPDFAENGEFYVHYTAAPSGGSVISRFTADNGALLPRADPASETVLIEQGQPYSNHNGGMLAFGPDGFLYIAFGDGGGRGDPEGNAQDLSTILGKILRVDVRGGPGYTIPADNPFAGQAGARGEIWAYGFRNPYRFSFDRETGALWAGDVGQGSREEVDLVTRGGNYGWNLFEGSEVYLNPDNRPAAEFIGPVAEYGRSEGISVIGGYVYRGDRIPALSGAYLFGDYGSGTVWALVYDGAASRVAANIAIAAVPSISSFGEGASGEIYVISLAGGIYRLEAR